VPVLAEQAIRGAAGVKDRQIVVTWMLAAFTYPVGDAVGRQRITVPLQQAALRSASQMDYFTLVNRPQTTETAFFFADGALVAAQFTLHTLFAARRLGRKVKLRPRSGMCCFDQRTRFWEART
jgi:hypothetical protein